MRFRFLKANDVDVVFDNPVKHSILDRGSHAVNVIRGNFHHGIVANLADHNPMRNRGIDPSITRKLD